MPNAEDTLLPGREAKLSDGTYVKIEPWSLRVGRRVLEPVNQLLVVAAKYPEAQMPQLIDRAFDEVLQIVKVTLDWDDAEIEKHPLEDVIELATVILEVCLVRDDGGGLMGKMIRFGDRGGHLLLTAALGPDKATAIMQAKVAELASSSGPTKSKQRTPRSIRKKTHSQKSSTS